jgi:hypothetical protein
VRRFSPCLGRRRLKRVLALAIVLAGTAAVRFGQAAVADGIAAYERGDFATTAHALADQRALVLRDRASDLQ